MLLFRFVPPPCFQAGLRTPARKFCGLAVAPPAPACFNTKGLSFFTFGIFLADDALAFKRADSLFSALIPGGQSALMLLLAGRLRWLPLPLADAAEFNTGVIVVVGVGVLNFGELVFEEFSTNSSGAEFIGLPVVLPVEIVAAGDDTSDSGELAFRELAFLSIAFEECAPLPTVTPEKPLPELSPEPATPRWFGGGGNAFGVILVRFAVMRCCFDRVDTNVDVASANGRPCHFPDALCFGVSLGFAPNVLPSRRRFFLAGRGGASSASS